MGVLEAWWLLGVRAKHRRCLVECSPESSQVALEAGKRAHTHYVLPAFFIVFGRWTNGVI